MKNTQSKSITAAIEKSIEETPEAGWQQAFQRNVFEVKSEEDLVSIKRFLEGVVRAMEAQNREARSNRAPKRVHYRIIMYVEEKWKSAARKRKK